MRDELSVLSAFLTIAEERSFTRAARRLDVSPSALSHAIRGLEQRVGKFLQHRIAFLAETVAQPLNGQEQALEARAMH